MKNNVFIKFDFDETNFEKELSKFKKTISYFRNSNTNFRTLKYFPPCITKERILKNDKITIISHSNRLLTHNIYFGEDFIKINILFKHSPFISKKCRNCIYFKNGVL